MKCPHCHHDVIQGLLGDGTPVLLDPHYPAYAAVAPGRVYPEDGDRLFLTTGLVIHGAVCIAQRKEQSQRRAQYKTRAQGTKS